MKKNSAIKDILKIYKDWIPNRFFVIFILLSISILKFMFFFVIDNDFWFLINTGKYILNNGMPLIEPFTIHENFNFIAQQWLSSVIFYKMYSSLGNYGMLIITCLVSMLTSMIVYKICTLITNDKIKISFFISIFITILINSYITTRPQLFDILFITLEIYLLESYIYKNNKKYLLGLPIISILMINLHASTWLMTIVIIIPYIVEYIINIKKKDYKIKPILLITIIMLLFGLINPYGINDILYLFKSYGIDSINSLVGEMKCLNITSTEGKVNFIFMFIVLFSFYCHKNKAKFNIRYFLLFLGTAYLTMAHNRGMMLLIICSVPALCYNFKDLFSIDNSGDFWNKYKRINYLYVFLVALVVGIYGYSTINLKVDDGEVSHLDVIATYLDNNASKDIKLYTNYDNGGYMEYRGYKCYIDSRAEVFLYKVNNKEDIINEYVQLQSGYMNIKRFLDKYNFDYLLLANNDIIYFNIDNDKYEQVYIENNVDNVYHLYKRKNINEK